VFVTKPGAFTDLAVAAIEKSPAASRNYRRRAAPRTRASFKLLPGHRIRPGRPDHAPDRRAHAGGRSGEADQDLSRDFAAIFRMTFLPLAPRLRERVGVRGCSTSTKCADSPLTGLLRNPTSPRKRGEVKTLNNPPAPDRVFRRRDRAAGAAVFWRPARRRGRRGSSGRRRPHQRAHHRAHWLCRNERAEVTMLTASPSLTTSSWSSVLSGDLAWHSLSETS